MRDKLLGTSLAEKYEILKFHFFVMLYLFKEKTHEHDKDMHKLVNTIDDNIIEL